MIRSVNAVVDAVPEKLRDLVAGYRARSAEEGVKLVERLGKQLFVREMAVVRDSNRHVGKVGSDLSHFVFELDAELDSETVKLRTGHYFLKLDRYDFHAGTLAGRASCGNCSGGSPR